MAKYKATVNTALDADKSFGLMADFANAEHWDPATKESKQLDDAPIGVGSTFKLTMEIAGRENDIVYEIVEFEAPHKVVLRGENSGSVSVDTITVADTADGSSVTYDADVSMKGAFKVIGPFFGPVFKKMGDQARDKMGEWLDGQAAGGA
jgi:hypothetical protein